MKGLKNVNALIDGERFEKVDVGFENGKIAYIGGANDAIESITDAKSAYVAPGFIDEHIHGAMGCDAMDCSVDGLKSIANAIASEGTTAFLATTMTQSETNIIKALHGVKEYRANSPETGAELLGVHLEGPFISKNYVGAQPVEYVIAPDVAEFDKFNEASGNSIKIVSMAVEEPGAEELVKHLTKKGIIASIGHSGANYTDIEKAVKAGASNVTHTYNAQKPVHHREIGVVGSAMLFDELNAELICDTIHVSVPAIKLILKVKPKNKVTLITDSMRAKHLGEGLSELGGQTVIVKNGEARLENGALAGSILKMNDAVKNLVKKANVNLIDAINYASRNVAENLKLSDKMGTITLGKAANFVLLNEDMDVVATIRGGNVVYSKN